jgi:hypothetical protein
MDMESDMVDGDMDMLNFGKTSTHYPSSSRMGYVLKEGPGTNALGRNLGWQ